MYSGNCEIEEKGCSLNLALRSTPIVVAVPESSLVLYFANTTAKGLFAFAAFSTYPLASSASLLSVRRNREDLFPSRLPTQCNQSKIRATSATDDPAFRPLNGWLWEHNKLADVPCYGWRGKVSQRGRTSTLCVSGTTFKLCRLAA